MTAQQSAAPAQVQMFANLEQNLFIKLQGDPKQAALNVHHQLKGRNARIGLDRVMALIDGKETMFKGYEVVTIGTHNEHFAKALPQAHAAPVNPGPAPQPPAGPQSTAQPSAPVAARGRGRTYDPDPTKPVVALKRGKLYTRIMEFLARPEGATMQFMVQHSGNKTSGGVNDVLGWQIKQKGYGLRYDQANGTYHLVFPKGQTELKYAD